MSEISDAVLPLSPTVCILGSKHENKTSPVASHLWALCCLFIKRLILLNRKKQKPECFMKDSWLVECLDLLNMERAASFLKVSDRGLSGHWDIVRRPLG